MKPMTPFFSNGGQAHRLDKVQRVLVYRLGSLGDMTVALPAFHLVTKVFPKAQRVLLTSFPAHAKAPAASAILENTGLVHGYMRYNYGTRNLFELFKLWWRIRRYRPDVLIYMSGRTTVSTARRNLIFFKLCGVKRFFGVPLTVDMNNWRLLGPGDRREAESARLMRNLSELGTSDLRQEENWDLHLTMQEIDTARIAIGPLLGGPIIICGPGTKMQAKDWGRDNWRALLDELGKRYQGVGLALIGAKEDWEVSDFAASNWTGLKVNLCGKLTPRQSGAVFALARSSACVFIGPDSGPMHLAACAGVPCVICFSARGLPGVWFPKGENNEIVYHKVDCFGCNLETCTVERKKCLTSISVDEMLNAVSKIFEVPPET